jgi:glycosyltransferase involved in cell wall biosynthesis
MPGIHFFGDRRAHLFEVQRAIKRTSHFVTVISQPAADLWQSSFGVCDNLLVVPGGVDAEVSEPGADPFPHDGRARAVFAGNVYHSHSQPEAHTTLVDKLNRLGGLLHTRNIQLYMLGQGDLTHLDPARVMVLGPVPYAESWRYLQHADVGVVVSAGYHHNNESSKLYHYLRAGLPIVSEAGFPNDHVITESACGYLVKNGDLGEMAAVVETAVSRTWPHEAARAYVLKHHTWDRRVEIYDTLFKQQRRERAS